MSESAEAPVPGRLPDLATDPRWIRELEPGTMLARIYRTSGPHPTEWFSFREYGPLDGRYDPHSPPPSLQRGTGIMYAAVERAPASPAAQPDSATDSAFAACLLEVFQQHRIIDRTTFAPTVVMFEVERPLRLLDLAESDWAAAAGGNAAITSGSRARAREWARAIRSKYPELHGIFAPSSLVPSARIAALWETSATALPTRPEAIIPLSRIELHGVIDAIATRYGYDVLG